MSGVLEPIPEMEVKGIYETQERRSTQLGQADRMKDVLMPLIQRLAL